MSLITQKLSYGVYVVTTTLDGVPKGLIANSAMQVTAKPATFAVSINHDNHTNGCIKSTGKFAISVLAVDTDPANISVFGFKSGKDFDKFSTVDYKTVDGMPVIADSCGYIICKVIDTIETITHTVFIGEMTLSEQYGDREQMTYDYYHKAIKGSAPKNAPTYVPPEISPQPPATNSSGTGRKYICTVCGYEHDGELPDDFICPICGVGAELFTEVK